VLQETSQLRKHPVGTWDEEAITIVVYMPHFARPNAFNHLIVK
jgi:hypothetical protein